MIFVLVIILLIQAIFWIFISNEKNMMQSKTFGFIKKMFIGWLSACPAGIFNRLLASNSEGLIKCISPKNRSSQARPN